jgi:hypothetical protein
VAGLTPSSIYLGNTTAPQIISAYDWNLKNKKLVTLNGIIINKFHSARLQIDSPWVYISDINHFSTGLYSMVSGVFKNFRKDSSLFAEAVGISPYSMVLRTVPKKTLSYVFEKESYYQKSRYANSNILQPQVDGLYSTDGSLNYDPGNDLLVYVYYYRNEYICMDTDLSLISRGELIDTNSVAKLKVANVLSDHSIVLSTPPLMLNKSATFSGAYLFIASQLLADNEKRKAFQDSTIVDVYNLRNRLYQFSFYLPKPQNQKIKSIKVDKNNQLVALYEHSLFSFTLNSDYFPNGKK